MVSVYNAGSEKFRKRPSRRRDAVIRMGLIGQEQGEA
jgi:hypothetical protein